jgi:hypothetical protein
MWRVDNRILRPNQKGGGTHAGRADGDNALKSMLKFISPALLDDVIKYGGGRITIR